MSIRTNKKYTIRLHSFSLPGRTTPLVDIVEIQLSAIVYWWFRLPQEDRNYAVEYAPIVDIFYLYY